MSRSEFDSLLPGQTMKQIITDKEAGFVDIKPRRSCNLHKDCDAYDAKRRAEIGNRYNPYKEHCDDTECPDCFGN